MCQILTLLICAVAFLTAGYSLLDPTGLYGVRSEEQVTARYFRIIHLLMHLLPMRRRCTFPASSALCAVCCKS